MVTVPEPRSLLVLELSLTPSMTSNISPVAGPKKISNRGIADTRSPMHDQIVSGAQKFAGAPAQAFEPSRAPLDVIRDIQQRIKLRLFPLAKECYRDVHAIHYMKLKSCSICFRSFKLQMLMKRETYLFRIMVQRRLNDTAYASK